MATVQHLPALSDIGRWLIDTGLLGAVLILVALWPAFAAGFRPEGIEEDDKDDEV